jgi:hypothetical protein
MAAGWAGYPLLGAAWVGAPDAGVVGGGVLGAAELGASELGVGDAEGGDEDVVGGALAVVADERGVAELLAAGPVEWGPVTGDGC